MSKEASDKRYRIELNEKQLRVIYNALEEWFRIPLGQWRDTAQRLAFRGDANWAKDNAVFERMIQAEDHAEIALKAAGEIARGREIIREEDEIIASDMWRIIRNRTNRAPLYGELYQESDEPPIKLEVLDADIMRVGKCVFTADGSGGVRIREEEGNDGK